MKPWKRYFNEYLAENFIFAVQFLARHQTTKLERYWWICWIGSTLAACGYSMFTMYEKWESNPVALIYDSELMPISTIPLPAVTICPVTKSRVETFNLTWVMEMLEHNTSIDESSERKLRALAHVCTISKDWRNFTVTKYESVVDDLRSMRHSMDELIVRCRWRFTVIPCSTLITEQLLDDGFCYTFNSLSSSDIYRADQISPDFLVVSNISTSSDWTRDRGYLPASGFNAYPLRPLTNGIYSGFIFAVVARHVDRDPLCMAAYSGYKIAIHAPDEVALTNDRFFRMNTLSVVTLTVVPKVVRATRTLRNMDPHKRMCYFSNERRLQFFKIYNRVNCAVECLANYTLAMCGCVKFSLPRISTTKICDASKIDCYSNAFMALYKPAHRIALDGTRLRNCQCLPSCTSIDYEVGMSQAALNFRNFPEKVDYVGEKSDPSMMFVSFKHRHYIPMIRREMANINQSIADLGGLFTLLMGTSMLSLAEIMYYCCVRGLRRERSERMDLGGIRHVS